MARPRGRGLIGLDIGTSAVRAAEVSVGSDRATLRRFGQVKLPEGAVRDGEIVDGLAVTAAIRQLWQRNKFSGRRVVVGVANQRVVVRQVELPWMPVKELRKSLAFQVGEFIPMPVDEAVLDFDAVEEVTDDEGRKILRVMLVAAGREMVRNIVDVVRRAGLRPVSVDLAPFALMRALGGGGTAIGLEADAEALIDVGSDVTTIVVHRAGVPRFVRVLTRGGHDLTDALAERLGTDYATAEMQKLAMRLAPDPVYVEVDPASQALETAAAQWLEELRQSIDFYKAQSDSIRLRRLVLTGGGAQLDGLAQRVATRTRLPVVVASPLSGLKVGRAGLKRDQLRDAETQLAVPVGLALGRVA